MKTWVTNQSDFWDMLALKAYNAERGQHLMHKLIEANFWARKIAQFSGGLSVSIPAQQPVREVSLVPWKTVTTLIDESPLPGARAPIYLGAFERFEDLPPIVPGGAQAGDVAYVRSGAALVMAGQATYTRFGAGVAQGVGPNG